MATSKWSNVAVAIGTLGTEQVVSAITAATPPVATYVGADPSNGTYIALTSVLGMTQVNNRLFRVANMSAGGNTLELEGEVGVAYTAFTSGNMQPITFGTTLTSGAGVTVSGGDFAFIDTTTIHDITQTQIPGLASATIFTFDCFWDPSDTALVALVAASTAQSQRALRITFANSYKFMLLGYVGATLSPTGNAQDMVKTSVVFTAFGRPTTYTT